MRRITITSVLGLLLAGCGATAADSAPLEDEAGFLAGCRAELVEATPQAASWADAYCADEWQFAGKAVPMADALVALAPEAGSTVVADMRAPLTSVQWSSATEGKFGDLTTALSGSGRISFNWQKQMGEVPYRLFQALRIRGVTLETLGCPTFMGPSLGREKVMLVKPEGRIPFVLAVYSRNAPTGTEYGVYEVDADFSGAVPDRAALAAGRYPGGGGRAFAGEPTGWVADCPDPEN
ncbi:MAG: hypothetical protein R3E21_04890 [Caenibius sp.]